MKYTGFRRLIAFLSDFFFCFGLSYFLLSQEQITSAMDKLDAYNMAQGLAHKHLILSTVVFVLFRFYFSLIFKLTPFQYLVGLKLSGSNFIQVRLCAVLRVIFMPVLLLLFPIDKLLEFFKKFTLTDILMATKLDSRGGVITLALSPVVLLISLGIAYSGPLLYQNTFMLNPEVNFIPKVDKPLAKDRDFTLFKTYGSKTFKLMTFTDLDSGRFKIQPSYEIRRKAGKLVYRPMFSIWDTTLGVKGKFKISSRFDLFSLIKLVRENDIFFKVHYPELEKSFVEFSSLKEDRQKDDFSLNKKAKDELFQLVSYALLSNPFSLGELVKNGVPNIFPYVILKNGLFEFLGDEAKSRVDFITRGNEIFIRKKYSDSFTDEFREVFFSFNQLRPIVYETIWEKNRWDDKINDAFSQSFYVKSKWGKAVESESLVWERENIFNPLSILDFLGFSGFSQDGRQAFEKFLQDYYFEEAKASFKLDEAYQTLFHASMQRVFVVWELMKKKEQIPSSPMTTKMMTNILRALKAKDYSYFGLNDQVQGELD